MLERKSHVESVFITLTYDPLFIPIANKKGILVKEHLTKFIRKLRKELYRHDRDMRYMAVGEYGDLYQRPHFHICAFGIGSQDKEKIKRAWTNNGISIGRVHIGEINAKSARYIAGYTVKKLTNKDDYRLQGRTPEFMLSSRKNGGIGSKEVRRIAQNLKKNPHFDEGTMLSHFKHSGKELPLGGYLTKIFIEELGLKDDQRLKKFKDYQFKILTENNSESDEYYFNLENSVKQKAKEREAKAKSNYNKRRLKSNASL